MKKNDNEKIYDEIMFNNAGSANDCTGLIPSAPQSIEQIRAYEDVYNFSVPEVVKKNIQKQ